MISVMLYTERRSYVTCSFVVIPDGNYPDYQTCKAATDYRVLFFLTKKGFISFRIKKRVDTIVILKLLFTYAYLGSEGKKKLIKL